MKVTDSWQHGRMDTIASLVLDESPRESVTTIFCPYDLREEWRVEGSMLPGQWRAQYPGLFDVEDLKLADGPQRNNHFCEWFSAIYLFLRDGSRSLVEKYDTYDDHPRKHRSKTHQRKIAEYEGLVSEAQREVLDEICMEFHVQLPDLFVISADTSTFSFAEVKGPTDHTLNRLDQRGSRDAIRTRLGVPVEVIKVRLVKSAPV
jgi:hypothetical protein